MNFINFNEHISEVKRNKYGGSEKKRTVILDDNKQYLLKFPDPTREQSREISYINNAISEYIGCRIFKQLGFQTQDTILGTFTDEKGKEKIACACKDIRGDGGELYEAENLSLEFLDEKQKLTFEFVKSLINRLEGIDADSAFQEYCNRFVVDAFIGNTDRHNGNWGFIENENGFTISPVYDCGSSFSPLFSDSELSEELASNEALNVMSAILDENGRRIKYSDYLITGKNENVNQALTEVVPKINLKKIYEIIDEIPYISNMRKDFYKRLIDVRYKKVLIPALENVLGIEKNNEYKTLNSDVINYLYTNFIERFLSLPDLGKVTFQNDVKYVKSLLYVKNNDTVFFLKENGSCCGMALLCKSNLNVAKFLQSASKMGILIDIDGIKEKVTAARQNTVAVEKRPSLIEQISNICADQAARRSESHEKSMEIGNRKKSDDRGIE